MVAVAGLISHGNGALSGQPESVKDVLMTPSNDDRGR